MNGLTRISRVASVALLLGLGGMFAAGGANAAELSVTDVWARPSAVVGGNGAGYFTVENKGGAADTLLRIEADVSKVAELHSMTMDGMVMKMRKMDSAPVPANGQLVFAPGGNHIMFIGLKAPLKDGDSFPVTFVFEHAGSIKATMKVGQPKAAPMGGGSTGSGSGDMGSMGGMH